MGHDAQVIAAFHIPDLEVESLLAIILNKRSWLTAPARVLLQKLPAERV